VFSINAASALEEKRFRGRERQGIARGQERQPEKQGASLEEEYRGMSPEQQFYHKPNGWTRKVMIIGRHGDTPKDEKTGGSLDMLLENSFGSVFEKSRRERALLFGDEPIAHNEIRSITSPRKRTQQTTRASTVPFVKGRQAYTPKNEKELIERHGRDMERIQLTTTPLLDYEREVDGKKVPIANMRVYKEKNGAETIINHWMQNPTATEHRFKETKQEIKPYYQLYGELKSVLANGIATLLSTDTKVVDLRSHGTVVEPALAVIAESGGAKIRNLADLGGEVPKEGYGVLVIDVDPKTQQYRALLKVNNRIFQANIENIMNPEYNPHHPASHMAGQQVSYDLDHEPSQQELNEMQLQQQRGYETKPRSHEPKAKEEDVPANRYKRYAGEERRPLEREERYRQPAHK